MTIGNLLSSPEYSQKIILQKLICETTKLTREEMRTKSDQNLDEDQIKFVKKGYEDYVINKKPLEYIIGRVTFFEKDFYVNENTLVPRPETEYMIQAVTEFIQTQKTKNNLLLDVGTGCGVLGTSVLLQNPDFFPNAIFSDISQGALEVAKKNYFNLIGNHGKSHTKVQFLISDLVDYLSDKKINDSIDLINSNIILVANLPYIPDNTFDNNAPENVKNREPRMAFVGGDDGLDYYRTMFSQIIKTTKNYQLSNINFQLFLEMMTRQVDILRKEFDGIMEFEEIKTFHFNIRIVKGKLI